MSKEKDFETPPLHNLQAQEVKFLKQMFMFYDIKGTGKIRQHHAHNIYKQFGLGIKIDIIPYMVSFKDLLLLADTKTPNDPSSEDNIDIFCRMVSKERNGTAAAVNPKHISDFLGSVQQVAPSTSEANLLITSMIEYDDCSEDPVATPQAFRREVLQAYKELQLRQQAAGEA